MAQTRKQKDRHTDGHGDSMTELAQWGRFIEKERKDNIGATIHTCR